MEMFYGKSSSKNKVSVDCTDVEDVLYITMEEEFSCQLEDGSPADIAGILVEMATKCQAGDFSLSRRMVQFAEAEKAQLGAGKPPVVVAEDDMSCEGDDDEDDDDDGNGNGMSADAADGGNAMDVVAETTGIATTAAQYASGGVFAEAAPITENLPPPRQLGEPVQEKPPPVLDEDGFEAVVPRRSRRKNKGVRSDGSNTLT